MSPDVTNQTNISSECNETNNYFNNEVLNYMENEESPLRNFIALKNRVGDYTLEILLTSLQALIDNILWSRYLFSIFSLFWNLNCYQIYELWHYQNSKVYMWPFGNCLLVKKLRQTLTGIRSLKLTPAIDYWPKSSPFKSLLWSPQ